VPSSPLSYRDSSLPTLPADISKSHAGNEGVSGKGHDRQGKKCPDGHESYNQGCEAPGSLLVVGHRPLLF